MPTMLNFGDEEYSVCGQLMKTGPWSMKDEKTGEMRHGHSAAVAILGKTVKAALEEEASDALEGLIGKVVQLTGCVSVAFESTVVKLNRVDKILHGNQVIWQRAADAVAAALPPPRVAEESKASFIDGVLGRKPSSRAA